MRLRRKGNYRLTIKDMQSRAHKSGGECLSAVYLGTATPLLWKCQNKEHPSFWATPRQISSGTFCKKCSKREITTIEDMIAIAKKHNGKCITKKFKYVGGRKNLVEFQCDRYPDHPRFMKRASTIHNHPELWCPKCQNKLTQYTLKEVQKIAEDNKTECLSLKYKNQNIPMQWKCSDCGNVWTMSFRELLIKARKGSTWCKECREFNKSPRKNKIKPFTRYY